MTDAFGLSDIALWNIIIGFIAPLVVALVARPALNPWAKIAIQVAFCLVVGVITAYLYGQFDGRGIVSAVLLTFAVSILAYKGFWKQVTPELKEKTSVTLAKGDDSTYKK